MANPILIMGEPGTGKTVSIRNLDPKATFVICADEKPIPLPKSSTNYKTVYKTNGKIDLQNSNYYETTDAGTIIKLLEAISSTAPHITTVVIDTITSVMTDAFMERLKEPGYGKFGDFAKDTYDIIKSIRKLRDGLTVVVMSHLDTKYDEKGELRSSFKIIGGKLVGEKIPPEAYFHMILYTEVVMSTDGKPEYYFLTQNNGKNTCRSPLGLFSELRIPNDLKAVIDAYNTYEK
jgi:hypothetical protein